MNNSLAELNDNLCIVTDDTGTITLSRKENNNHSFEEILETENKLENLIKELTISLSMRDINKQNSKNIALKSLICFVISLGLSFFINLTSIITKDIAYTITNTIPSILLFLVGVESLLKGSIIGRYIKNKRLNEEIKNIATKISKIKQELTEMRESTKYEELAPSETEDKSMSILIPKSFAYIWKQYDIQDFNQDNNKKIKIKTKKLQ